MLRVTKSIIESLGVSLPDRRVTTAEILAGCKNAVRLPLERLTGIKERRLAGDGLYSIDLAEEAVKRCLSESGFDASEYDLLVCTNISRRDSENQVTHEPSTATTLKQRLGFTNAMTFDLSNACAGMWTGVYLVDALIRTSEVRRGLVVSGEYISYLIKTAQLEIADYMDPQIASLTLGDAGVAVSLGLSPSPEVGLHDLDLYTLSKYSPFCVAKPTDQSHGGAVMYTDAIKVTEAVVPHAARHAKQIIDRNGWPLDRIDHIVPHQTSQLTMQEAKKEFHRLYQYDFGDSFLNNLAKRGNTSSNSHFLALFDGINDGKITAGQDLTFCISGSGQTTGTALYTMDDLPDRMLADDASDSGSNDNTTPEPAATSADAALPVQMMIEAAATLKPGSADKVDTLGMLTDAANRCFEQSEFERKEIDLLMSVGTYRTEFVMEPAIAALAACRLSINEDRQPGDEHKTLAFDLLSGPVGFLKSCYMMGELARAGQIEQGMVLASEVENNREVMPDAILGLEEMASAVVLSESLDETSGFLAFSFQDFIEDYGAKRTYASWNEEGLCYLHIERDTDLRTRYMAAVQAAVPKFLNEQNIDRSEIALLLPPQISPDFVAGVADALEFLPEQTVSIAEGGNLATSSTPAAYLHAVESGLAKPGDLGLMINVGAGIQVACALYQF